MATPAADILAHVVATLAAIPATEGDGPEAAKLFASVGVFDDMESFTAITARTLTAKVAGVVAGEVARGAGLSGEQDYAERLPLEILFSFAVKRNPGKDEAEATGVMHDITRRIRAALLADNSRGGKAHLTNFDGRLVNGTDVDGTARLLDKVPNQAIYTAGLPAVCGWSVNR
jgi:hypothetical protein